LVPGSNGAVPDLGEELLARADRPRAPHHEREQLELPQRERDLVAVDLHDVALQRHGAHAQEALGRRRRALSQARAHARKQLGERERLGQVVVGPDLQAAHLGLDIGERPERRARAPTATCSPPPSVPTPGFDSNPAGGRAGPARHLRARDPRRHVRRLDDDHRVGGLDADHDRREHDHGVEHAVANSTVTDFALAGP
jgi:hypothetical protein